MILLLVYMICIFLVVMTIVCYLFSYKTFKDIKCDGPFPWPIIGNLTLIWDLKAALKKVVKLPKTYGKVVKFSSLGLNGVFIFDPELLKFIMTSTKFNQKGFNYQHLKVWLGDGILTSFGHKWRNRRKMLTPIFHYNILRNCVENFQTNGDILIQELQKHANGESFDICPWLSAYVLDVFSGTNMNTLSGCNIEYLDLIERITKLIVSRYENIFTFYDFTYKFTRASKETKGCANKIDEYAYKIIREKRSKIELTNEQDEFGVKKKGSFLDLLLNSTIDGQPLSDEDIREEINTFTFGGFDTSSGTMAFALYEISRNPKVQEEILQEALTILGKGHRNATYKDLRSMTYLEMVIKETLRLYPPAIMTRIIKEDVNCDWGTFKANTNIIIVPYVIHRMPEYFPNPDMFDPNRFSLDNLSKIKPWSYFPFSAGERNCIGQKFGMLVMKSTISQIVMNYKVLPDRNFVVNPYPQVTLKSVNGIKIKLEKRF